MIRNSTCLDVNCDVGRCRQVWFTAILASVGPTYVGDGKRAAVVLLVYTYWSSRVIVYCSCVMEPEDVLQRFCSVFYRAT